LVASHAQHHQRRGRVDEEAIALPPLRRLLAAQVLFDFFKDIGHWPLPDAHRRRTTCGPRPILCGVALNTPTAPPAPAAQRRLFDKAPARPLQPPIHREPRLTRLRRTST